MKEELNKCYRTLALILLVVLLLAITSVALRYKEHGNESPSKIKEILVITRKKC
ncbi:MAG: hypothetical protein IIT96_06170 [Muribaculaceae bacterium]|nr:hypothetical protein [Muribaculaceae bacterium]